MNHFIACWCWVYSSPNFSKPHIVCEVLLRASDLCHILGRPLLFSGHCLVEPSVRWPLHKTCSPCISPKTTCRRMHQEAVRLLRQEKESQVAALTWGREPRVSWTSSRGCGRCAVYCPWAKRTEVFTHCCWHVPFLSISVTLFYDILARYPLYSREIYLKPSGTGMSGTAHPWVCKWMAQFNNN